MHLGLARERFWVLPRRPGQWTRLDSPPFLCHEIVPFCLNLAVIFVRCQVESQKLLYIKDRIMQSKCILIIFTHCTEVALFIIGNERQFWGQRTSATGSMRGSSVPWVAISAIDFAYQRFLSNQSPYSDQGKCCPAPPLFLVYRRINASRLIGD